MWLKLAVPPPPFPLRCAEPSGVWELGKEGGQLFGEHRPPPPLEPTGRQGLVGGIWGAVVRCWAGSAPGGAGWGECSRGGPLVASAAQSACVGARRWPRTLAGITAYQPCLQYPFAAGPAGGGSAAEKQAWRRCDRAGRWEEGDYSHCLYTNDITRVLYTFVLVRRGPGEGVSRAGAAGTANDRPPHTVAVPLCRCPSTPPTR